MGRLKEYFYNVFNMMICVLISLVVIVPLLFFFWVGLPIIALIYFIINIIFIIPAVGMFLDEKID